MMQLLEQITSRAEPLIALRRDLHAHPELAFNEHRTSDLVAKALSNWNIPVDRGLGGTGVVGIVRGGDSGRAIGLRADMDALPILEENRFAHASTYPGHMHACGHDGHIAMLLAAAQHLSSHRSFDGTVYLIFQPAEEGAGGARRMIEDGLFERFPMDAIFGIHNWPGLEAGKFAVRSGPVFASATRFSIRIKGKGAHAAMPHNGIDPVITACHIVQAFQTVITRSKRPADTAVLSVTRIHGGEATNVIPGMCEVAGTVRTFAADVLDLIEARMRRIADATCEAFGATCEFSFDRYYPSTINSPIEAEFVRGVLKSYFGQAAVVEFEPTMTAEDFSFYLQIKPGCYFVIGNGDGLHRNPKHGDGPCMLHNPSYDFNDALIPIGAAAWVAIVEAWFSKAF